jgi:protein TonB
MSYATRKEISGNRTAAIVIVAILHAILGYAIVTGLAYNVIKKAAEDLKTFDVEEEPPPPEETPPPPENQPDVPPPVVAPPPIVRIDSIAPPPVVATPVAPPPVITPTVASGCCHRIAVGTDMERSVPCNIDPSSN